MGETREREREGDGEASVLLLCSERHLFLPLAHVSTHSPVHTAVWQLFLPDLVYNQKNNMHDVCLTLSNTSGVCVSWK